MIKTGIIGRAKVNIRANLEPSEKTILILIVSWILALIPHVLLVSVFLRYPIALDDMYQYDMLGRSLSDGKGYRWYSRSDVAVLEPYLSQVADLSQITFPENGFLTTFRAPGYPFFLAGLYTLVPVESRVYLARLVQATLFALLTPLTILVSEKMGLGVNAALLAGLGMAFYPILLFYPVGLASENLYVPLVLISLIVLIWAANRSSWRIAGAAGILLGLLMLTRSILAPFVFLSAVWLARFGRMGKKGGAVLFLVAFGVCLPWAIRNTWIMKRPAFVENSLGYNLFVGYHPEGNGGFVSKVAVLPLTILDDRERDQYCMQRALEFIRADPIEAIYRVIHRAVGFVGTETRELTYFYSNNYLGYISQPWLALVYLLLVIPWVSTTLFALLGFLMLPKPLAWLVLALVVGYTLPHLMILTEPRFHLALVPVLVPLAASGWTGRRLAVLTLKPGNLKTSGRCRLLYLGISVLSVLYFWDLVEKWDLLLKLMGPAGNKLYLPY